jgi:hypothetical protein
MTINYPQGKKIIPTTLGNQFVTLGVIIPRFMLTCMFKHLLQSWGPITTQGAQNKPKMIKVVGSRGPIYVLLISYLSSFIY